MTRKRGLVDLVGPTKPNEGDIPALNQLFSDSFTDRYRRDGLIGVRVPQLNPNVWRYALRDAEEGARVWFDEEGELVAFNVAHHSGTEGWMGPLAVASARQATGIGQLIVESAIDWLREVGVTTLGLETMPRTVDNIGFYGSMGFEPQHLTVTMTKKVGRSSSDCGFLLLDDLNTDDRVSTISKCAERLDQSALGYDFTREFDLTTELGLGDVVVVESERVRGFALWHSAPLAIDTQTDDLRVLKLFAESDSTLNELLTALEECARSLRLPSVSIRCQTAYSATYRTLMQRGYRVKWTDLRMTLQGYPEAVPPEGETLFSNWEI